jgi:hypothetical protein
MILVRPNHHHTQRPTEMYMQRYHLYCQSRTGHENRTHSRSLAQKKKIRNLSSAVVYTVNSCPASISVLLSRLFSLIPRLQCSTPWASYQGLAKSLLLPAACVPPREPMSGYYMGISVILHAIGELGLSLPPYPTILSTSANSRHETYLVSGLKAYATTANPRLA